MLAPNRRESKPNTTTCETTCAASSQPCLKCLTSTHARLLAFRLPIRRSDDEPIPPPPPNAAFADKLQWLAVHRPHTLEPLADAVEAVLQTHRQPKIYIPPRRPTPKFSPTPAMTMELSGDLRYRSLRVFDHACGSAP